MDVHYIVDRLPRWERGISRLLMDDREAELRQSIVWYEELAAFAKDPGLELQLAILEGEAGRRERLREKLDAWDVRMDPFPAMATLIAAAYLNGDELPDDDALRLLPGEGHPWFGEQLVQRLALRRNDATQLAEVAAARAERTTPLRRRVRALVALDLVLIAAALAGVIVLVKRRDGPHLASASLPPAWSGSLGAAVILRGAALQVLLLGALYVVSHVVDSAVLNALTWPWSNVLFVPMLLLARRDLMRPSALRFRDALGLSLDAGKRGRLFAMLAVLIGLGLLGDWVAASVAGRFGLVSHWTEWFDEDLVWGAGGDAAIAILSACVTAPFFEEIVFRGLLFATFRRRFGFLASAVLSALIFAVAHGYGWVGLTSVLWSGVLWCWSYERTRSLVPGMLAHAVVNLLATLSVLMLLR